MKDAESVCRLRDALESLYRIIDKAGISNLANGVQLGHASWLVKANDAMDHAKHALNTTTCACKEEGDQ